MPNSAASRYVTEQRCAVSLWPRLCASSIAAPSIARVTCMYALNDVAPTSDQADFITDAVRKLACGRKAVDPELALAALDSMQSPLTSREADALRMVAKGFTTAEIADGLCLTVGTVRNYLSRAIAKTGARNRVDAIRIADESAWL